MSIYSEIKKYLLFLVGFFCFLIIGHVVLLYFYHDAEKFPLPGGTINVGFMGESPVLNAFSYNTQIENDPSDTLLRFIQRGLLRFSVVEKKIVGDLATCSIDGFPAVRCKLTTNALWNDGSPVTPADVVATYKVMKEKNTNETTKSLLSLVEVSLSEQDILFQFRTRDVTALQTLFMPIMREKDLGENWNGALSESMSWSGPYVYPDLKKADKGIYLLTRNPFYTHTNRPFYFDQVRFGFGVNNEAINDIINADLILTDNTAELEDLMTNQYTRPVLHTVFLNSQRLPASLRKAISTDVLATADIADPVVKPIENIFLGEIPNAPRTAAESQFFQTVFALGYSFGGTFQAPVTATQPEPEVTLKFITEPGKVSPLFVATPTIVIKGLAPAGTNKIVVNDYTLRNFAPKGRTFAYTAQKEFGNLVPGKNIYKVQFWADAKLLGEESVTIYHNVDTTELTKLKTAWTAANTVPEAPAVLPENLDSKKLYNRDGAVLSFDIIVQSGSPYLKKIADQAAQKLRDFGTDVTVQELSSSELIAQVKNPDFRYDMIFTGIHLGVFHYDVAPFLHSTQVKNGYNMARIQDATLDALLSRLTDRLYFSSPERLRDTQIAIQKILERESAVFTLGSPYEYLMSDDAVLGLNPPEFLAGQEMLIDILSRPYLKEGYKRSAESKTIIGFFEWLKHALFPS